MFRFFKSILKSAGKGIAKDPEIEKLKKRFPRFFHFIKKRLTPNEKFGLYLTIGTIFTLFFIYLFFGIVQDYIGHDPLIESDLRIINLVQIFRTPKFSDAMLFITYLGKWQTVFLGTFFVCVILFLLKRWYHIRIFLISVTGGEILVWIIKNLVERSRPPLINALVHETSYSFPSGHSFVAFSFYGLLAYYLFRISKNKLEKFFSIFFGLLIIASIGFSRIYLGVHWPSDVLASFASGAAWLTTLITTIEIKRKFNPHQISPPHLSHHQIISILIILFITWTSFVVFYFKTNPLIPINNQKIANLIHLTKSDIPDKLFPSNNFRFSETITGNPMEPINIIVVGSQKQLFQIFQNINWLPCDPINFKNIWRLTTAVIFNQSYPQAPGTPSFWNTQPNEISFEQQTNLNSARERHHIHFWNTPFLVDNQPVWFGTAHFDKNAVLKNNFIPTHIIDPAVDKERDHIKNALSQEKEIKQIDQFQIVEPTLGKNQAGSQFFTDGEAFIIYLQD